MLTKNQVSQVADELIAQQQALSAEQRDASARSVPLIYRCAEIARLAPREQAAVLRRAKSIVLREWLIYLTVLVLFATVLLAWWVSHGESKISGVFIAVLALAAVAVNVLRALMVRLVVRLIAGHPTQAAP